MRSILYFLCNLHITWFGHKRWVKEKMQTTVFHEPKKNGEGKFASPDEVITMVADPGR